MKTKSLLLAALSLLAFAFLLPPSTFAQSAADSAPLIQADTAAAIATPFIVTFALKYPVILSVIAAMGALRFFFKPIVSLVEAYVRSTPGSRDDEYFDRVNHSAVFKAFAWLLDFGASIKVGPQFTALPEKK